MVKRKAPFSFGSGPRDLGHILTSPVDSKNYKAIQLENGLKALLVSTCRHVLDGGAKSVNPNTQDDLNARIREFNKTHLNIGGGVQSAANVKKSSGKKINLISISEMFKSALKRSEETTDVANSSLENHSPPKKSKEVVQCCLGHATVCINVGVGSFHDPEDIYGLAHLVEHLVFLGSKQYPQANELFIKAFENGGMVNATTLAEQTEYYFSCIADKDPFQLCLKILIDGIINPNLKEDVVRREILAIDSEYGMKQTSDITRVNDFIRSRATLKHPMRTFYWGNKESLSHPNLLTAIKDWRDRYYKANFITVCVQAPFRIEDIEKLVLPHLMDIPASCSCTIPRMELLPYGHPFTPDMFHTEYYIMPVTHFTALVITWCLPAKYWQNYETKPLHYIRTMLNSPAPGGLISYLRRRHWITETSNSEASCNCTDNFCKNSFGSLFTISIYVTEEGYRERHQVLLAVFSYIKMLQQNGISQQCFEAMSKTLANLFHFQNWDEMLESGKAAAQALHQVKPEHVLTSQNLLTRYDPQVIRDCLYELDPRKACFLYISNTNADICKSKTWPCNIRHVKFKMSEATYIQLAGIEPYQEFTQPVQETFLCKEIEVKAFQPDEKVNTGLIVNNDKMLIRHTNEKPSPCITQKVPSAKFFVYLQSPFAAGRSRINSGILDLWNKITVTFVISQIGHKFHPLCRFAIGVSDEGINFTVEGPTCHLTELTESIMDEIMFMEANRLCQVFYNNLKLECVKEIINETFEVDELATDVMTQILVNSHVSKFQVRDAVERINYQEFLRIIRTFKSRMRIEMDIQGVLCKNDMEKLQKMLFKYHYRTTPIVKVIVEERCTIIPRGSSLLALQGLHPAYITSFVINYYQFGRLSVLSASEEEYFKAIRFGMKHKLRTQLRTVEQLGYTVYMRPHVEFGCAGIVIGVVTLPKNHSCTHVDERIDAFLQSFYKKFVASNVNPKNSLFSPYVKNTRKVHQELGDFYENHLLPKGDNFRKLSIQVTGYLPNQKISKQQQDKLNSVGNNDEMTQLRYRVLPSVERNEYLKKGIRIIDNVAEFKRTLGLYPVGVD